MSKTVVIHQPDFVPYLGFFHRFLHADCYVALDHVQFVYGSRAWTHRDKIKTAQGAKWLTISVQKATRDAAINRISLSSDTNWRQNHLRMFDQNYRNAPFYREMMPELERLYAESWDMLREFNMGSIEMLMDMLNVRIPWVWSSSLGPVGAKNELLADLTQKVSGTHYLSGVGARDYFEPEPFAKKGIEVVWQDFTHPEYEQRFGNFVPYLSVLDVLFNHGVLASREILRRCG